MYANYQITNQTGFKPAYYILNLLVYLSIEMIEYEQGRGFFAPIVHRLCYEFQFLSELGLLTGIATLLGVMCI